MVGENKGLGDARAADSGSAVSFALPTKDALGDLIRCVESASGPDRLLDAEIEVAVRWLEAARAGLEPEHRAKWKATGTGAVNDSSTGYFSKPVTASLDAALGLVERVLPGWSWMVRRAHTPPGSGPLHVAYVDQSDGLHESATGPTPALALCLAFLKAMESQHG